VNGTPQSSSEPVEPMLLTHHLKTLKLPTFLSEYDKVARQCAEEGVDHTRYLLRLSELELIDRERRMVERRIKQARFPTVKSLDMTVGFTTASALVHELMETRDERRLLQLQGLEMVSQQHRFDRLTRALGCAVHDMPPTSRLI